ncbi:phospho-sugar mutase [Mycoplasma iguanae]|uniref:Phospho-sugar mutase n=1 Tax=Mycoplasma iguanae TaxID=292461 RepID=A0ABY5RA16_9MOLU|nr:phospho-sugar mutase [Mycoplasma iguanae]UVD81624.1 phospho-sugar mutase [Mycoplasma iguanae]
MQKLEFGTAGIRGILGQGEKYLNIFHVYNIVEGLAQYLINNFSDAQQRGVVIGRDSRDRSLEFAQAAAAILDQYNIKVYFSEDICPTPVISYAIKKYHAIAGINVTASHNPKNFNGLKFYNYFGSQMLPDEIDKITPLFKGYNFYLNKKFEFSLNKNISYIKQKIFDQYLEDILKIGDSNLDCSDISIAFSPLNGTGAKLGEKIFQKLKVNYFLVKNQMANDPNFTYCQSLNPENPLAFCEVNEVGKKHKADIVLITDPDADRVGLGVWNEEKKDYVSLTGNETATLIFQYLLEINKDQDLTKYYLIYSIVSSSLPKIMAEKMGIKTYPINTGFKWAGKIINNQNQDKKMLFAFEESYGSLIDKEISFDKDALQSLVILSKMTSFYKKQNLSLLNVLENIYQEYGYVISETISIDLNHESQLTELKEKFAKTNFGIKLINFLDYNQKIGEIEPTDMLIAQLENNAWISLRPSGTEPKIKFYIFLIDKNKQNAQNNFLKIKNKIEGLIN